MTRSKDNRERGQAIVMVTLSMVLVFGMLGLVVDLGWGFFVKGSAQAAADAAALAAARKAYSVIGQQGNYDCGPNLDCQSTALLCSSIANSSNLHSGCQYAQQNFDTRPSSQRSLRMRSGTSSPFATATGDVATRYWVTATVAGQIPQLFSAVLGNTTLTSSARATAAVVTQVVDGALILLNRRRDRVVFGNTDYYGVNLLVQANDNGSNYALQTTGSIRLASTCAGTSLGNGDCQAGNKPAYAGVNQGGGTVYSPSTSIVGTGSYNMSNGSRWTQTPSNGAAPLDDPMSGKGQPPVPTGLNDVPVPGGVINSSICPSGICSPGKYYATTTQSCGNNCTQQVVSGEPLVLSGTVHFAACSGCDPATSFGGYIFFGGLTSGGGGANVTFDPGVYVFAGVKNANNNTPGALLDTGTGLNLRDYSTTSGPNTVDAGELFIFTGVNAAGAFSYPGLASQLPGPVAANASLFQMGTVSMNSGNNGTTINLHGLNPQNSLVRGTPLETFGPSLMWQDQANSSVKYDASGHVDTASCGSGHNLDNPCANTLSDNKSPELGIQASPNIHLYGYLYQPRGAWTTLQGGGGYSGALKLITGAVNVQGNANVDMLGLASPVTATVVSLIE